MTTSPLTTAILNFANATHNTPETILNGEAYAWDAYAGNRYAFLHITLALRGLAGRLLEERFRSNCPVTLAQHALAEHQAALRDFQALLLGVPDDLLTTEPKPEEWSIRTILLHVHEVERYFFAAISSALDGGEAHEPTELEAAAAVNEPVVLLAELPLADLWANYIAAHTLIQRRLQILTDADVQTLSTMWEPQPLPVLFRMQRFAAHLREHTNQLEKTLHWLGRSPNEAKLLLRQMFAALAEVEGLGIGMGDLGEAACAKVAGEIDAHAANLQHALVQTSSMVEAVRTGDLPQVQSLLAANPALAGVIMETGISAVMHAQYHGRSDIVRALLDTGMRLPIFESAALGETARVRRILGYSNEYAVGFARDGFTALQLACFFGHAEVVRLLLDAGADVHAVAKNEMRIQPIHAAVAARSVEIVRLLIEAGADVNAMQQNDFTPLMAALQNGDEEIEAMLRAAGAVG